MQSSAGRPEIVITPVSTVLPSSNCTELSLLHLRPRRLGRQISFAVLKLVRLPVGSRTCRPLDWVQTKIRISEFSSSEAVGLRF